MFLSVDQIEELAIVRHRADEGTTLFQPEPLARRRAFRVLSEFDSDRAELFLARAVLLVEGRTEKMTFPLVFDALGVEPDKEGILILECGGKGNIPLFARICNACDVPYVVVHDRDAPLGQRPVESERIVNQQILDVAGKRRTVVLAPDFEAVSGVSARGGAESRARRTGATAATARCRQRSARRSRRCCEAARAPRTCRRASARAPRRPRAPRASSSSGADRAPALAAGRDARSPARAASRRATGCAAAAARAGTCRSRVRARQPS